MPILDLEFGTTNLLEKEKKTKSKSEVSVAQLVRFLLTKPVHLNSNSRFDMDARTYAW